MDPVACSIRRYTRIVADFTINYNNEKEQGKKKRGFNLTTFSY